MKLRRIFKKTLAYILSLSMFIAGVGYLRPMQAHALGQGTYGAVWYSGDTGLSQSAAGTYVTGSQSGTYGRDSVAQAKVWMSYNGTTYTISHYESSSHDPNGSGGTSSSCSLGKWSFTVADLKPNVTYSASCSAWCDRWDAGDYHNRGCSTSASVRFKLVMVATISSNVFSGYFTETVSTSATLILASSWKFQSCPYGGNTWTDLISCPSWQEGTFTGGDYSVQISGTYTGGSANITFPISETTVETYYRFLIYVNNNYSGTSAVSNTLLVRTPDCSVDISEVILDPTGKKVQQYTKYDVDYEELLNTISITATIRGAITTNGIYWQYRNDEDPTSVWTNLTDTAYHTVDNSKYAVNTLSGKSILTLKSPGVDANLRYRAAFNYSTGTAYSEEFGYTTLVTPKIMRILVKDKNDEVTKVKKVLWHGQEVTRVYFGLPEDVASKRDHIVYGY